MTEYNDGDMPCKRCQYYLVHSIKFPCRACDNEDRSPHPHLGEKIKNYFRRKVFMKGESW